MSPYPGSQKREAEGRGALRLSDLVMSGVTALLPEWAVERGRTEGHLLLTFKTPEQAAQASRPY